MLTHPGDADTDTPAPAARRAPWLVLVALAVLVVAAAAFVLGRVTDGGPSAGAVDVGFAHDMTAHHEQAVEMALTTYARTDDPELAGLAKDIAVGQQAQIGMMTAWLDAWREPATGAGPAMTWMGMSVDGLMPGMATAAELAQLKDLSVADADELFLRLMIRHHSSGVDMAEYARDHADTDEIRNLANGIVLSQQGEISTMQRLLTKRGLEPEQPNDPHAGHG